MTAFPILTFLQSFIKFQVMVPEIQMKRAKNFILTYILITHQPNHIISKSWLKSGFLFRGDFSEGARKLFPRVVHKFTKYRFFLCTGYPLKDTFVGRINLKNSFLILVVWYLWKIFLYWKILPKNIWIACIWILRPITAVIPLNS